MKYAFFPGCAHDTSAGYRESLEAVCQKLDIELVEIPDWNCCGATIAAGESKTSSLYLAARAFALSEKIGFTDILTGCNACYTTLRKAAKYLTESDGQLEDANRHLADEGLTLTKAIRVRHIMDTLFDSSLAEKWASFKKPAFKEINIAAYYGCQYTRPWLDGRDSENPQIIEAFLDRLGFNAIQHSAKTQCCGAAGAMPNASIARTLVKRIVDCTQKRNADAMITICPLCQFNVDSYQNQKEGYRMPVLFFTQLLGLYLNIDPATLGLDRLLIDADALIKQFQLHKKQSDYEYSET